MSGLQDNLAALAKRDCKYELLMELYDIVGEERFKKVLYAFAGQSVRFPSQEKANKLLR